MTVETWDVVVVGAGPAGSATAARLAGLGHRVLLIDRAHFPRQKACAEYLSPGVMDALRDLDLHTTVAAQAHTFPGMEIISPRARTLRVSYQRDGSTIPARSLPRLTLDGLLLERAVSNGAVLR